MGGSFTEAGGSAASKIAKWDGSSWSALGGGVDGNVWSILIDESDIYAGGYFTTAGIIDVNYIAKWDGSEWSALGSGLDNGANALALEGDNLYVGGNFTLAGGKSSYYFAIWDKTPTGIADEDIQPLEFSLLQNYPNPFNPKTVIGYQLSVISNVELTVYNYLGQRVQTLVNKQQQAGSYTVRFNAGNLASGVYFYKLQAGDLCITKKMLLVK
ncbi:MAG: T9SS type A sorting domain-containing protein [Calditrichales bacterium]|nr:T9SS type A sorting domain-containing protein [Calditrichales bacterium]